MSDEFHFLCFLLSRLLTVCNSNSGEREKRSRQMLIIQLLLFVRVGGCVCVCVFLILIILHELVNFSREIAKTDTLLLGPVFILLFVHVSLLGL